MSKSKRTLLFLIFLVAIPKNGHACLCIASTPQEYFADADFVFIGRLQSSIDKPPTEKMMIDGKMETVYSLGILKVTLKVEKIWKWKGKPQAAVVVETPDQSTACGVDGWGNLLDGGEKSNEPYLVYAYAFKERAGKNLVKLILPFLRKTRVATNRCAGTGLAEYAEEELKFLNTIAVRSLVK